MMHLINLNSGAYIAWSPSPWKGSLTDPSSSLSIEDLIKREYGIGNIGYFKQSWYTRVRYSDGTFETAKVNASNITISTKYMHKSIRDDNTLYDYAYSIIVPIKLEKVPGVCSIQLLLDKDLNGNSNRLKVERVIIISIMDGWVSGGYSANSAPIID